MKTTTAFLLASVLTLPTINPASGGETSFRSPLRIAAPANEPLPLPPLPLADSMPWLGWQTNGRACGPTRSWRDDYLVRQSAPTTATLTRTKGDAS